MAVSSIKNIKTQNVKAVAVTTKLSAAQDNTNGAKVVALRGKREDAIHASFKGRFKITGDIVSPLDIDWGEAWDAKK